MERLLKLKIELKNKLAEGLDLALKSLGEALDPTSLKYNDFIQQKSRYTAYLSAIMIGGNSPADLDRVYNAISHAYLLLVDTLTLNDVKPEDLQTGASRSKRGELLYHIPHAMEMGKEHACRVRVAYLLDVIFEGWKRQAEDAHRQIRIAEIMSVEMLNLPQNEPFAIRSMTEVVQFLDADDYTEWLFYIRPLRQGEFPLLLKVSVVEVINGREVKKDVVIEEHVIVSNEVQADSADFKEAGIQVTFQQVENPVQPKVGGKPFAPALLRNLRRAARPLALFLAFLMLSTAATYASTTKYTRGYWWARVQDSEQAYVDFIREYDNDPTFQTTPEREKSFFRLAKVSENPQLVREYVEKIDSAAMVQAHWTIVVDKLKALEIKAVTSLAAQPTKEKVEQYVANFPEMNLLPKVLHIIQTRPELPTAVLPVLEKAAVRQIGNPNVQPVQIKMYQLNLPAGRASLQEELEKRPALKQEVEQVKVNTDAAQEELFVYTKQDYKKAGKTRTTTNPYEKAMPQEQLVENNNRNEERLEERLPNATEKDTDGDSVPDNQDPCPAQKGTVDNKGCPPADRDADGIADANDQCPDKAGEARWQGCPDTDGDSVPDDQDACPEQKGTAADKGCPPADRDADGVADANDKCPDKAGEFRWRGCPDTDGDGLPDNEDACPAQKGSAADKGCPPADRDADGIADANDKCPDKVGEARWGGCPDTDGDGLPDNQDVCPEQKGTAADKGCPPAAEQLIPDDGMVFVKGGIFQMGSNDNENEKPVHRVTLDDFYIGKYEVTQKQWRDIMGSDPLRLSFKGCDNCPVESVSWDEVQEFLRRLNAKYPGRSYCLPTEAEWEYAARGGDQSKGYEFAGSDNIDEVAWSTLNSGEKSHAIGGKKANELVLFDMSGNVREWCSDWYGSAYYKMNPVSNPKGPDSGTSRVHRGGSFLSASSKCRVADRGELEPEEKLRFVGFRLARH
ncbi:MAG: SUMF1/EgtB/PvdO family nonheme iron enzyme [Phycisphaerae bacterium]|nr:SUMF1/EgtB/PvdO family nonheme iron enzyme [Saprospiraceae bacterium]